MTHLGSNLLQKISVKLRKLYWQSTDVFTLCSYFSMFIEGNLICFTIDNPGEHLVLDLEECMSLFRRQNYKINNKKMPYFRFYWCTRVVSVPPNTITSILNVRTAINYNFYDWKWISTVTSRTVLLGICGTHPICNRISVYLTVDFIFYRIVLIMC